MKLHNVQIPEEYPVESVMVTDDGTVNIKLRPNRGVSMLSVDGKSVYAHSEPPAMDTVVVRTRLASAIPALPPPVVGAKRRR